MVSNKITYLPAGKAIKKVWVQEILIDLLNPTNVDS